MNSSALQPYFSTSSILNNECLNLVELTMTEQCTQTTISEKILVEHLGTGGKRLRARLALSTLSAIGINREEGIYWAASVEMLHNTTLIHDDIQDGDQFRRGKPTSWVLHGIPQAINAGDLGLMLPFLLVHNIPTSLENRYTLMRWLADSAVQTVHGQSKEMELLPKNNFFRESYLDCIKKKTGSFFSLPVKGSALIAGISECEAEKLGDAFLPIGILFQMQDDILDLYGDKGRDNRGSDLKEGKVSNLVIEHFLLAPEDRLKLVTLLHKSRDSTTQVEIDEFIEKFRNSGALDNCLRQIQSYADDVFNNEILKNYPDLYELAQDLIYLALNPIEDLLR